MPYPALRDSGGDSLGQLEPGTRYPLERARKPPLRFIGEGAFFRATRNLYACGSKYRGLLSQCRFVITNQHCDNSHPCPAGRLRRACGSKRPRCRTTPASPDGARGERAPHRRKARDARSAGDAPRPLRLDGGDGDDEQRHEKALGHNPSHPRGLRSAGEPITRVRFPRFLAVIEGFHGCRRCDACCDTREMECKIKSAII